MHAAIPKTTGNNRRHIGPAGLWSSTALGLAAKASTDDCGRSRPNPAITTPVGRPNFPSYPSAHSCLSAAYAAVLDGVYPSAVATLEAAVVEAGEARIYAGLHYRFDVEAGQALGRSVGKLALSRLSGGTAIPLR